MFERTRAQLPPRIDAQRQVLADAQARRDAAQHQVDAIVAAVASAQVDLASAQTALTQAVDAVAAAQANRDGALGQRDAAATAVTDWLDAEPENPLPNGRPNPAWPKWNRELGKRRDRLKEKRAALTEAENALATAIGVRDAAATRVSAAQDAVTSAQEGLTAAKDHLQDTLPAVAKAERELAELLQVPAELDARAARILAEPLDRTNLEQASDAEMLAASTRRRTRQDLWTRRLEAVNDCTTTLAAHDATADDLAALAAGIRSWPGSGSDPALDAVATALEAIAQTSRNQRMFGTEARSDDLDADTATLLAQADTTGRLLAAANTERGEAVAALQRSGDALAAINKQAPKR